MILLRFLEKQQQQYVFGAVHSVLLKCVFLYLNIYVSKYDLFTEVESTLS